MLQCYWSVSDYVLHEMYVRMIVRNLVREDVWKYVTHLYLSLVEKEVLWSDNNPTLEFEISSKFPFTQNFLHVPIGLFPSKWFLESIMYCKSDTCTY